MMKALTSTEDYDLLVLGSGAGGNPSKSTRTLRPTSASSQAIEKPFIRYAKTVMLEFNSSKGDLDLNGKSSRPVTVRPPMKKWSFIWPPKKACIFFCSISINKQTHRKKT